MWLSASKKLNFRPSKGHFSALSLTERCFVDCPYTTSHFFVQTDTTDDYQHAQNTMSIYYIRRSHENPSLLSDYRAQSLFGEKLSGKFRVPKERSVRTIKATHGGFEFQRVRCCKFATTHNPCTYNTPHHATLFPKPFVYTLFGKLDTKVNPKLVHPTAVHARGVKLS